MVDRIALRTLITSSKLGCLRFVGVGFCFCTRSVLSELDCLGFVDVGFWFFVVGVLSEVTDCWADGGSDLFFYA